LQAQHFPTSVVHAFICDAIVHAVGTALPELDPYGLDAVTAPMQRTRRLRVLAEPFAPPHIAILQLFPALHRPAILAGPCAHTGFARARHEVCIGDLFARFHRLSFHTYLALVRRPEETHGRARITFKVHRLAAVVVGIEDETIPIERAQQHDAAADRDRAHRG